MSARKDDHQTCTHTRRSDMARSEDEANGLPLPAFPHRPAARHRLRGRRRHRPGSSLIARHLGYDFGIAAAFAQDSSSRADTYRLLTLFGDVFERVRAEYVDPVNDKDLVENAINGMLTGLDPHSSYMNAKAFRDMQVQTKGEFGGLGIEVTQDNGFIKVISPIDDTPASKPGIKAGDIITALDGKTVQGLSLNDAVDKMRGAPNSKITLTIKREGVDKPLEISMLREVIQIQVVKAAHGAGRHRLYPADAVHRAGRRRHQAGGEEAEAAGGRQAEGTDPRPAQQSGRPAGSGGGGVRTTSSTQGEIVSTRARHPEDASAGTPRATTSPAACRWWC